MHWADTIGAKEVLEQLKPYESLGKRYQPTDLMKDLASKNAKYYDLNA